MRVWFSMSLGVMFTAAMGQAFAEGETAVTVPPAASADWTLSGGTDEQITLPDTDVLTAARTLLEVPAETTTSMTNYTCDAAPIYERRKAATGDAGCWFHPEVDAPINSSPSDERDELTSATLVPLGLQYCRL